MGSPARNRSNSSASKSSRKRSVSKSKAKRYSRSRSNQRMHRPISRSPIRHSSPYNARRSQAIQKSSKLFVTNIDSSYNSQQVKSDLQKQFIRFGPIKQITVKTKRGSTNSFAFVQFERAEDAQAAQFQMKGKNFKGKELKVEFGKGERKDQDRRADKCYICHRQGHFAQNCRYRERSVERRDSREYARRRRYSRSVSSSRSYRRRRRSPDHDRDYRMRDRERQYRRSPGRSDRRRQYPGQRQRRQRY